MKKKILLFGLLAAVIFTSCEVEDIKIDTRLPIGENAKFLALSEGAFGKNNSELAYFNLAKRTSDSAYFSTNNNRALGDVANDMVKNGTKVFVVVNVSSQIEVIDANTGKSLKSIPMFNGDKAKEPRQIITYKNKIYVSSFDDTVTRIDATTMAIDGTVKVGFDPEGMCVVGEKLYVANSGGLEWQNGYDKTVSVVDINTFKELEKIEVNTNPAYLKADSQGDIYVVSNGNYFDKPAKFQRIDTKTKTVTDINLTVTNFTIFEDKAYTYSYDYFTKAMSVQVYDCLTEKLVNNKFISDGTVIKVPYSISIDPKNSDVFITDAIDNKVSGDIFCFDKNGKKKYSIPEVGLNPNKIIFLD